MVYVTTAASARFLCKRGPAAAVQNCASRLLSSILQHESKRNAIEGNVRVASRCGPSEFVPDHVLFRVAFETARWLAASNKFVPEPPISFGEHVNRYVSRELFQVFRARASNTRDDMHVNQRQPQEL